MTFLLNTMRQDYKVYFALKFNLDSTINNKNIDKEILEKIVTNYYDLRKYDNLIKNIKLSYVSDYNTKSCSVEDMQIDYDLAFIKANIIKSEINSCIEKIKNFLSDKINFTMPSYIKFSINNTEIFTNKSKKISIDFKYIILVFFISFLNILIFTLIKKNSKKFRKIL